MAKTEENRNFYVDIHCPFTVSCLRENLPIPNIGRVWSARHPLLRRLLLSAGTEETFVGGDGADFEKFAALLAVLEGAVGNPLRRVLEKDLSLLLKKTVTATPPFAAEIWEETAAVLTEKPCFPRQLAERAGVSFLPVAPADLREEDFLDLQENLHLAVRPSLSIDMEKLFFGRTSPNSLQSWGARYESPMKNLEDLTSCMEKTVAAYASCGARFAEVTYSPDFTFLRPNPHNANEALLRVLRGEGETLTIAETAVLTAQVFRILSGACRKEGLSLRIWGKDDPAFDAPFARKGAKELYLLLSYLEECGLSVPVLLSFASASWYTAFWDACGAGKTRFPFLICPRTVAVENPFSLFQTLAAHGAASTFLAFAEGDAPGLFSPHFALFSADLKQFLKANLPPAEAERLFFNITAENPRRVLALS